MPEFKIELTLTHHTVSLVVRAVNLLLVLLLNATAILHFVSGFDVILGIYLLLLSGLLAFVDWTAQASWLVEYAGFLVTFEGRALACGLLGVLTIVPPRNSYAAAPWYISFGLLFLIAGVFFASISYAKRYMGDVFEDVKFPRASDLELQFRRFEEGQADTETCGDSVIIGLEDGPAEITGSR